MARYTGRIVGLALLVAVPIAGVMMLERCSTPRERPAPYVPPPFYSGPPQDGLTVISRSDVRQRDVSPFRFLALFVPEGERPAGRVAPGPFQATFRGRLDVPTRDRYRFWFQGAGALELKIGETVVLKAAAKDGDKVRGEAVRLAKGLHELFSVYESPARGPAMLRVGWECSQIAEEPIPATALAHDESPSLRQAEQWRWGRELVAELRCGRCHAALEPGPVGPELASAGARMHPAWIAAWLLDPRQLHPQARMPALLKGEAGDRQRDARDIAAFLASQGRPEPIGAFAATELVEGGQLFAELGCTGCHYRPDRPAPTSGAGAAALEERLPLDHVAAKWRPAALVAFLRAPRRHAPASRMPDFGLDEAAARRLAAFLLSSSPASASASASAAASDSGTGDAGRGRERVAALGCARCHGLPVADALVVPAAAAPAITGAGRVRCTHAGYGLSAADEAALQAFLGGRPGGDAGKDAGETAVEAFRREFRQWRCAGCHGEHGRGGALELRREEVEDLLDPDLLHEPAALAPPPDLGLAGSKLRTEWLVAWLRDPLDFAPAPRPWLAARMPRSGIDARRFARGMAFEQGLPDSAEEQHAGLAGGPQIGGLPPAAELRAIGARLLVQQGGFGCDQCHAVGQRPARQVFEAPGIDLLLAPARLRRGFFHRLLRDPQRVDPASRMTRFADDDGRTGHTDILGGRAERQFEAIWRHLEALSR